MSEKKEETEGWTYCTKNRTGREERDGERRRRRQRGESSSVLGEEGEEEAQ